MGCNLSFTNPLNTSFLLWNGWIILGRLNSVKDFATSFPSLNLHTVNLLLWRKELSHFPQNYYINQAKHTPQGAFYGGSGFASKGGIGEESEPSHQKKSVFPLSFMLHPIPPLIADQILEKILAFKHFTKTFASGAHFQFHNHDLFQNFHWHWVP